MNTEGKYRWKGPPSPPRLPGACLFIPTPNNPRKKWCPALPESSGEPSGHTADDTAALAVSINQAERCATFGAGSQSSQSVLSTGWPLRSSCIQTTMSPFCSIKCIITLECCQSPHHRPFNVTSSRNLGLRTLFPVFSRWEPATESDKWQECYKPANLLPGAPISTWCLQVPPTPHALNKLNHPSPALHPPQTRFLCWHSNHMILPRNLYIPLFIVR